MVVGIWQCPRRGILLLESTITANMEQKVAVCIWGPTDLSFDRPQKQHRQEPGRLALHPDMNSLTDHLTCYELAVKSQGT